MREDPALAPMAPEQGRDRVDREAERGAAEMLPEAKASRLGVFERREFDTLDALFGPPHTEDLGAGRLLALGMPSQHRRRVFALLSHQRPAEAVSVHAGREIREAPQLLSEFVIDGAGELLGQVQVVLDGEHRHEGLEEIGLRDARVSEDAVQELSALSRREVGVREREPLGRGDVLAGPGQQRSEGAAAPSIRPSESGSDPLGC